MRISTCREYIGLCEKKKERKKKSKTEVRFADRAHVTRRTIRLRLCQLRGLSHRDRSPRGIGRFGFRATRHENASVSIRTSLMIPRGNNNMHIPRKVLRKALRRAKSKNVTFVEKVSLEKDFRVRGVYLA